MCTIYWYFVCGLWALPLPARVPLLTASVIVHRRLRIARRARRRHARALGTCPARLRAGLRHVRHGAHPRRSRHARLQLERAVPDRDALHRLPASPPGWLFLAHRRAWRPPPCRGSSLLPRCTNDLGAAAGPEGELSVSTAAAAHRASPRRARRVARSPRELGQARHVDVPRRRRHDLRRARSPGYGAPALRRSRAGRARPPILGIPLTAFADLPAHLQQRHDGGGAWRASARAILQQVPALHSS